MRSPQVVIYEPESRLTGLLRAEAEARRWTLRTATSPDSCLRLLRQGGPSVVVVKAGADVKSAMELLERCTWLYPEAPAVLVSDGENPPLAGLAWDLGARYVLAVVDARERLPGVVAGVMEGAARRPAGDAPPPGGAAKDEGRSRD
jgi:DNA-binding NtrC family response regulator